MSRLQDADGDGLLGLKGYALAVLLELQRETRRHRVSSSFSTSDQSRSAGRTRYLVEVQDDSSRRDLVMRDVQLRGALKLWKKQGKSRMSDPVQFDLYSPLSQVQSQRASQVVYL